MTLHFLTLGLKCYFQTSLQFNIYPDPNQRTKLTTTLSPSPLNTTFSSRSFPLLLKLITYSGHLTLKQSLCCLGKSWKQLKYEHIWDVSLCMCNLRIMTQFGDSSPCSPRLRLSLAHSLELCLNHSYTHALWASCVFLCLCVHTQRSHFQPVA